jgi:hypothetical protein
MYGHLLPNSVLLKKMRDRLLLESTQERREGIRGEPDCRVTQRKRVGIPVRQCSVLCYISKLPISFVAFIESEGSLVN